MLERCIGCAARDACLPEMHTYERCMPEMHARALLSLAKQPGL
jgi:hypothetical protein